MVQTADFEFLLPPELIAQAPSPIRGQSRLLVLERKTKDVTHKNFREIGDFFSPNDVLVLNNSRVIPARLRGFNHKSGGRFEIFLLEENFTNDWWAMIRPAKRAKLETKIILRGANGTDSGIGAEVIEVNSVGHRRLKFSGVENIFNELEKIGEPPLPPYITRKSAGPNLEDRERYQTVYAKPAGSVAAPTAGLHFSESLLEQIRSRGVKICFVTLHVGLGTFLPVKAEKLSDHVMHEERYEISPETVDLISAAKNNGHRIFAVGTTTVRVLESVAAKHEGNLVAEAGRTKIFILPPYDFKIVDALITNFHLPCSTLLMLVSAFVSPGQMHGREAVLSAYDEAIRERYRFFSFGDAMLIL